MGLLVVLLAWVCGSVGVVIGFESVKGGSVGGVAGMGVWVCCWRGCVDLLVVLPAWCVDAGESVVLKYIYIYIKKNYFIIF